MINTRQPGALDSGAPTLYGHNPPGQSLTGQNPEFANWRKSTFSTNQGGSCVEVAGTAARIGVRDSKLDGRSPVLDFSRAEWANFASDVRDGRFDLA